MSNQDISEMGVSWVVVGGGGGVFEEDWAMSQINMKSQPIFETLLLLTFIFI